MNAFIGDAGSAKRVIPPKTAIEDLSELRSILFQTARVDVYTKPESHDLIWTSSKTNDHPSWWFRVEADAQRQIPAHIHRHDGPLFVFSEGTLSITYDKRGRRGTIENASAAVIPTGTSYEIKHSRPLYAALVSTDEHDGITHPVAFTRANIDRHLQEKVDGGKGVAYKFVVPKHMNGETRARGGEFVEEHHARHLIVGPSNQEFSAGNRLSPQDFHVHKRTTEIFVSFGGMQLYYIAEGAFHQQRVGPGSVVIVPEGVAHYTGLRTDKPTFVIKGSKFPIVKDNFVLPNGVMQRVGIPSATSLAGLMADEFDEGVKRVLTELIDSKRE